MFRKHQFRRSSPLIVLVLSKHFPGRTEKNPWRREVMCVQRNTIARSRDYWLHGNATMSCVVALPVAVNSTNFQTATIKQQQCVIFLIAAQQWFYSHTVSLPLFFFFFLAPAHRLKFLRYFKTRRFGSRLCFRLHVTELHTIVKNPAVINDFVATVPPATIT
jgi:hypothetical protein